MKRVLTLSVVAALAVLAGEAFGAERFLGTVTVSDGGFTANARQTDAGFYIPVVAKISVQPDGHAFVCVDSHVYSSGRMSCTASSGVLVPAGVLFSSSCAKRPTSALVPEILADGGVWDAGLFGPTCTVACKALDGGTVNCAVFERYGDEAN